MYYGKVTEELRKLYKEYNDKFGYLPCGEMSITYNESNYDEFVRDIRECIETGDPIKVVKMRNYKKYHV